MSLFGFTKLIFYGQQTQNYFFSLSLQTKFQRRGPYLLSHRTGFQETAVFYGVKSKHLNCGMSNLRGPKVIR